MYSDDFALKFFEFLHEYSGEPEILKGLLPFISYHWGSIELSDGRPDPERENERREFIQWMVDNGASIDAIGAAINLLQAE